MSNTAVPASEVMPVSRLQSFAEPHAGAATVLSNELHAGDFKSGEDVDQSSIIGRSMAAFKIGKRLFGHFASDCELVLGPIQQCARCPALRWRNPHFDKTLPQKC
jgi:hypothetical protein